MKATVVLLCVVAKTSLPYWSGVGVKKSSYDFHECF